MADNNAMKAGDGNDTNNGRTDADFINVGADTDNYRFSATVAETQEVVIAEGATVSGQVVTGVDNGDKIDLATAAKLVFADGAITLSPTFPAAVANSMVLVSGSSNATTKVYTAGAASAMNGDYLIQSNGGTAATTMKTHILVYLVGTRLPIWLSA